MVTKKEIKKREEFANVYREFTTWLTNIGFSKKSFDNSGLYGVANDFDTWCADERYYLESLKLRLFFCRTNYPEHAFYVLDNVGYIISEKMSLPEFKKWVIQNTVVNSYKKIAECNHILKACRHNGVICKGDAK